MVRRSFRIGLRVGLLLGLAVAAVKMIQSRRGSAEPAPAEPWTPVSPEPARAAEATGATVAEAPSPPVGPATDPGEARTTTTAKSGRPLDEVGEPIEAPSPEPAPAVADDTAPAERSARRAKAGGTKKGAEKKASTEKATGKKAGAPATKSGKEATGSQASRAWVEPSDGGCPPSHPLKAKLSSKIFHRPGGLNYDRTSPDRCYADEAGAEADGLRPAKR